MQKKTIRFLATVQSHLIEGLAPSFGTSWIDRSVLLLASGNGINFIGFYYRYNLIENQLIAYGAIMVN